jgi:ribosomal protein L37E
MTYFASEHVLQATRKVRYFLPFIIGEKDAADLNIEIAPLIDRMIAEEDTSQELLRILCIRTESREWMRECLIELAPSSAKHFYGYEAPLGTIARIPNPVEYACPKCGRRFYKYAKGQPVADCGFCACPREQVVATYACPFHDFEVPIFVDGVVPAARCPTHPRESLEYINKDKRDA